MEFLQTFNFSAKNKTGKTNVIANAISKRYNLLAILDARVLGFEMIKDQYVKDPNFSELYAACKKQPRGLFYIPEGFCSKAIGFAYLRHLCDCY